MTLKKTQRGITLWLWMNWYFHSPIHTPNGIILSINVFCVLTAPRPLAESFYMFSGDWIKPFHVPRKQLCVSSPLGKRLCVRIQAHHVEGAIIAPHNTEGTEIQSLYHRVSFKLQWTPWVGVWGGAKTWFKWSSSYLGRETPGRLAGTFPFLLGSHLFKEYSSPKSILW